MFGGDNFQHLNEMMMNRKIEKIKIFLDMTKDSLLKGDHGVINKRYKEYKGKNNFKLFKMKNGDYKIIENDTEKVIYETNDILDAKAYFCAYSILFTDFGMMAVSKL